jgi:ATP-binding cassette subfamily B protein
VGIGLLWLVIVDLLEIVPPLLLKEAVDVAVEDRPRQVLAWLAGAYLATATIQALGRYGWRMYLIRSSMLAGKDLRQGFAQHLFGLSASFFDRRRIGDLMSLATNDIDAIRMAIGAGLLTLADALFYLLTVPVVMYLLSPKLTLLAFIPLPIIPFLVARNEREIHSRFTAVQEQFSRISALAQESLTGIRIVKAFAREDEQLGRLRAAGEEYMRLCLRLARVQTAFGPTLDFTMSMGLVALLFVGGRGVIEGAVTLGTFVAFQRYIQKMVWPMTAVGIAINMYQRAVASSGRLKEILAERTDVPEADEPRLPADYRPGPPSAPWRTRGGIEFRGLTFRFPGTDKDALKGVSLAIEPGERVAFVGTIGAGKSALLALLPRLYPVGRGMLFLDGVDVNDWPTEELRRQVGYVGQDVFLFSESVVENVAYGLHGWVSTSGQPAPIEDATQLASVHEDVLGLEDGYRTRLGERGVNLSGGQKQRLTIARALAKQPSVLVLDDALSSVDVQTEERILKSLRSRAGRNTEVIAAHRISTVKDADRIVVLDQGVVRQLGTHAALVAERRGAYRRFYEQQRLKEDLEEFLEKIDERIEERGAPDVRVP